MTNQSIKTAIIFSEFPESIRFIVLEGDLSHLHETYINGDSDEDKQDELLQLMYNEDYKEEKFTEYDISEFRQVIMDGAKLIECGFIL